MLTGVILAGGSNTDMNGRDQALFSSCGETLIERQIRLMKIICREMIIVTDNPRLFLPIVGDSVRIITDYFPGKGPIGGMHAAFSLATSNILWIVGSGMPFISAEAVQLMLKMSRFHSWDAIIPLIGERYEMLHGIYLKQCLNKVCTLLKKETSDLAQLNERLNVYPVIETVFNNNGISSDFVKKVNSLEEYREMASC